MAQDYSKKKKQGQKKSKPVKKNTSDSRLDAKYEATLKTMVDKGMVWYDAIEDEVGGKPDVPLEYNELQQKKRAAMAIVEASASKVELQKTQSPSSDDKYLFSMLKSGTLADRIAVTTLTIQSSPMHNLHRLSQLLSMAKKKARRESQMALEALKDLFLNNLLPDRKLNTFNRHKELGTAPNHVLALWYVESSIKQAYGQLVGILEAGMKDEVENHKRVCMKIVYELLSSKPELEEILLSLLVNKLGDPDRKVASKAMYLLQTLLESHPAMKSIVASDVERLLRRSNASPRSIYNAVLFLNQLYLTPEDSKLATHLITVYFSVFGSISRKQKMQKKQQQEADAFGKKLLSALLSGVNRAFPYANCTPEDLQTNIDDTFRVVHQASFATSVQALMLLFQIMSSTSSVSNRFYSALYSKLLDPAIQSTTKHKLFLNLLYKALKADVSLCRTQAIIKRLLQIATLMPPTFCCSVLFLISEVLNAKPALRSIIDQPEEHSGSVQIAEEQEEEQENILSAKKEQQRSEDILQGILKEEKVETKQIITHDTTNNSEYDALKRNPLYAGAENACAWELCNFTKHYHPSVAHFSSQVLNGRIVYKGDPLVDFTLTAFLEKYLNKNPKQRDMKSGHATTPTPSIARTNFANTEFARLDEAEVSMEDRFFHSFFKERLARNPELAKNSERKDKDMDDYIVDDANEYEDPAMEEFAQSLAEGLLKDDFYEDDDDEASNVDYSSEEDSEGENNEEEKEDENDDLTDEDFDEELTFEDDDDMSDDDEEEPAAVEEKKGGDKRKSPFASVDDYSDLISSKTLKKRK